MLAIDGFLRRLQFLNPSRQLPINSLQLVSQQVNFEGVFSIFVLKLFVLNTEYLIGLKQTLALSSLVVQVEIELLDACLEDNLVRLLALQALLHI